jgi:hypothetical protein
MPTIVFINKEFISKKEELNLVAKHKDGSVKFYIPQNSVYEGDTLHCNTVPDSRDYPDYRSELMQFIERFYAELSETEYASYKSIDLLSVIKYDLMNSLEKYFHPLWALMRIIRENPNVETVFYYPEAKTNRNFQFIVVPIKKEKNVNIILCDKSKFGFHSTLKTKAFALKETIKHVSVIFSKRTELKPCYHTVFVENYANSAKLIKPVLMEFLQSNIPTLFVAMRKKVVEAEPEIFSSNTIVLPEFTSHLIIPSAFNSRKFYSGISKFFGSYQFQSFIIENVDFNGYLKATLLKALKGLIKNAIRAIDSFEYLFGVTRIDNLLSTTFSGIYARAAVEVAKKHNCKTHYLQHGVLGKWGFLNDFVQENIYVWGERFKRDILKVEKNKQKNIKVVGMQDVNFEFNNGNENNLFEQNQKKVVSLFLSRMGGTVVTKAATKKMIETVVDVVRELNFQKTIVTLKIKVHPGNLLSQIEDLIRLKDSNVRVIKDCSTSDLILESMACMVSSSTVGLQVCAAEKPLIYLDMEGGSTLIDYKEYDAAYNVKNREDLKEILELLILKSEHPKKTNQQNFSREVLNSGLTKNLFQLLK